MDFSRASKQQSRKMRYQERAIRARKWAKATGFILVVTVGVAAWMDSVLGPQIQTSVASVVNKFESTGADVNGAEGLVSLLKSKLAL